jgi:hypothetical protein
MWQVVRIYLSPIYTTLALLGGNLLLAIIFGAIAVRSSPGQREREALAIRRRALGEARSALALGVLIPGAAAVLRWRLGGTRTSWSDQKRLR